MPEALLWIASGIVTITAMSLLLARNWRIALALAAVQYIGVFLLTLNEWTLNMAAVKLVTGWMCAATLAVTRYTITEEDSLERSWPEGSAFRLFTALLIIAASAALFDRATGILPGLKAPLVWGAAMLCGLGLLHLGITLQPMRVILSLLTFLSGFEVIYAAVENAILVTALLSTVNLGLALIGAYWINLERMNWSDE